MKEFIEKLIGRLEEELESTREIQTIECNGNDGYGTPLQAKLSGEICALLKAKEIVNQLAEEYNKKDFYEITLNGCDDDTCFVMEITENEHEFLLKVSEKANETSTYGCMPRLYVEKVTIKGE